MPSFNPHIGSRVAKPKYSSQHHYYEALLHQYLPRTPSAAPLAASPLPDTPTALNTQHEPPAAAAVAAAAGPLSHFATQQSSSSTTPSSACIHCTASVTNNNQQIRVLCNHNISPPVNTPSTTHAPHAAAAAPAVLPVWTLAQNSPHDPKPCCSLGKTKLLLLLLALLLLPALLLLVLLQLPMRLLLALLLLALTPLQVKFPPLHKALEVHHG